MLGAETFWAVFRGLFCSRAKCLALAMTLQQICKLKIKVWQLTQLTMGK